MSISQAVILAGGLGTRLLPFTKDNPKPMIPIEKRPFLSYLLDQIKSWGVNNVVLLLGYKAEKIEAYFGNGQGFGMKITYCVTPTEFDTGARMRAAYPTYAYARSHYSQGKDPPTKRYGHLSENVPCLSQSRK